MRHARAVPLVVVLSALSAVALQSQQQPSGSAGGEGSLRATIVGVTETPPVDQVHWGILAVDLASGRTLYSANAAHKFVPASNQKLLVAAGALSLLRPDYRWVTALWSAGPVGPGGVLEGDLVLPATGDPTLSERFHPTDASPLEELARQVEEAGVREIRGALVVDASRWDSTSVPGSWMVGNLPATYSATGGPFAIAEGVVSIEVTAGPQPGQPARIRWWPQGERDFVGSDVHTGDPQAARDLQVDFLPESRRLIVRGIVPWGTTDTVRMAIRDPVRQAAHALLRSLEYRGIRVEGGTRVAWSSGEPLLGGCETGDVVYCPWARRVAVVTSPPLEEVVEELLEVSQNWITEQVVRTLGLEYGQSGSWDEGFHVLRRFLTEEVGIDSLDVSLRDGSGLSAYNLVTPRALVRLLRYMRGGPHGDVYRSAMAEPGEDESTLENRLEEMSGRLWAKTGTITHVNALSGYLVTYDGREVAFSILTNGSGLSSSRVRSAMDEVVRALVR